MKLSKHFSSWEFECKCKECDSKEPPEELIVVLEDVREYFGEPVTVHSGYRCDDYNKSVGGSPRSQHKEAKAADITVRNVPPNKVHRYLINKYPYSYGIGKYETFTHIDVRNYKARW